VVLYSKLLKKAVILVKFQLQSVTKLSLFITHTNGIIQFSYCIGCKTIADAGVPENMPSMLITKGSYHKITVTGILPACVSTAGKSIRDTGIKRCFQSDFEIYDHRKKDWNNTSADIFIS
jgi:predicted transcriptional regulator YdeE